ncbi:hypothetical protein EG68_08849 [Paragonimus skrjabini miyazakii]|uniref:Dimethylargininase n=1 Tax=Paragonimus skrjabini miyazakii TaxID=59628 RepID=A0A8S9YP55_9TREM|nr:hypothetical protein EG68_08849 [Paragonimus skrjabini miyazakii]
MAFQYAYAIVSKIPDSFEAYRIDKGNSASREWLENAHNECTEFVETLRRIGVDILELKAEERHPECVKVDDTAVIINGTALMCNPYGSHRQGEVNLIRQTLKKEVGVKVVELNTENAQVEGSDVLFTGQLLELSLFDSNLKSSSTQCSRQ